MDIDIVRKAPTGLVALLWAGRQIEDLESAMDMAKEGPARAAVENDLKEISSKYSLASRVMSLAAVVKRIGDRAGEQPEQQIVPVGMPDGMQADGVFGTKSAAATLMYCASAPQAPAAYSMSLGSSSFCSSGPSGGGGRRQGLMPPRSTTRRSGPVVRSRVSHQVTVSDTSRGLDPSDAFKSCTIDGDDSLGDSLGEELTSGGAMIADSWTPDSGFMEVSPVNSPAMPADGLLMLLASLEADGGLPGPVTSARFIQTAVLALAVLKAEIEGGTSMYSLHLGRMASFLEANADGWGAEIVEALVKVLRAATRKVEGQWADQFSDLSAGKVDCPTVWVTISNSISSL